MTLTIEIPYTYEPEDEDEGYQTVTLEVDYDYEWRDDDFYITGFHCEECPEAAKAAEKEYYGPVVGNHWYDIVNEKIKEALDD